MPFAVPAVWREQKDYLINCYFCLTKIDDHNSKCKHTTDYANIPSVLRPAKNDDFLPIPKPHKKWTLYEEKPTSTSPEDEPGPSYSNMDPDFPELNVPHLVSQSERNNLVKHSHLSKVQAELLACRLQGCNLLQQSVKVSYRKRQQSLSFISKVSN
jgi:hypothetical protein